MNEKEQDKKDMENLESRPLKKTVTDEEIKQFVCEINGYADWEQIDMTDHEFWEKEEKEKEMMLEVELIKKFNKWMRDILKS